MLAQLHLRESSKCQLHPSNPQLNVEGFKDDSVDLFGAKASDLQDGVTVTANKARGVLKDLPTTDEFYTNAGFDSTMGTHFLVTKATAKAGNTIKFTFNGKTSTLDSDGILILQMTDAKLSKKITFKEYDDDTLVDTFEVALDGLELA